VQAHSGLCNDEFWHGKDAKRDLSGPHPGEMRSNAPTPRQCNFATVDYPPLHTPSYKPLTYKGLRLYRWSFYAGKGKIRLRLIFAVVVSFSAPRRYLPAEVCEFQRYFTKKRKQSNKWKQEQ
jgi:hypothetical protein